MKRLAIVCLAFGLVQASVAEKRDSIRREKPYGVFLSLLDPLPSLLGLTIAWNASSYVRLELGVGRQNEGLSHLTTWALGVKFLVPQWSLSPWAGFNLAAVSHVGPDVVAGFGGSGSHGYGGLGMEWLTASGFTASLGYQISTRGQTHSQPFLRLGWFFSI